MYRRFALALFSSLAVATGVAAKDVTVSVVTDGPSPQWDAVKAVFLEDLVALTEQEFNINAPVSQQFDGGWDGKNITAALDKAESDPKTDIVLVVGFAAGQQAATQRTFENQLLFLLPPMPWKPLSRGRI